MKNVQKHTRSARQIKVAKSTFREHAPLPFFKIPTVEDITGNSPSNGPWTWQYISAHWVKGDGDTVNYLRDGQWLDDSIMSAAMQILKDYWAGSRVFWVDSLWTAQFNPDLRPKKFRQHFKEKAEHADRYYFPYHVGGNHWFSLAYCPTRKKFLIFDSMMRRDPAYYVKAVAKCSWVMRD
ncbi:hypothetical protein HK104_002236 [Borealophlyctis nickersoniae]|nr:hypothetical protein HK104_002236 [Borealophlyctis nickersoniae]